MNPLTPYYKGGKPKIVFWWREMKHRIRQLLSAGRNFL